MKGVVMTFSAVVTALMLAGSGARAEPPVRDETSAIAVKQILGKLRADPELANNRIEVHVDKGVATLKGKVDSQMEKSRAVTLAAVPGVHIVDDQPQGGRRRRQSDRDRRRDHHVTQGEVPR